MSSSKGRDRGRWPGTKNIISLMEFVVINSWVRKSREKKQCTKNHRIPNHNIAEFNMTPALIIADSAKSFDVPLGALRLQYPGKRLVVAVAIVSLAPNDSSGSQRKLLLLQRAETEDVYPLMYELPGGNTEPDDTTLLSTVVREAEEETGLSVTKIYLSRFRIRDFQEQGDSIQFFGGSGSWYGIEYSNQSERTLRLRLG